MNNEKKPVMADEIASLSGVSFFDVNINKYATPHNWITICNRIKQSKLKYNIRHPQALAPILLNK